MSLIVGLVSLLLVLFLIGRGLPARRWPIVLAATLAVILAVVLTEQAGLWPAGWQVR